MNRWDTPRQILHDGLSTAYPAAVVEVGSRAEVLWEDAFGALSYDEDSPPTRLDSLFDLASLTKVIATTTLVMTACDRAQLALHDPVSHWIAEWRGDDRRHVTLDDLLAHASGLTAHLPFFRDHRGREEFERSIATLPLEYTPRTKSVYSDLGFILLGFVLEDAVGLSLTSQFQQLREQHRWGELGYGPGADLRARAVPTERDEWRGRFLQGEVHDENAWALGGAAGHAGLFGTAGSVGRFARSVLNGLAGDEALTSPDRWRHFTSRTAIPHSSRALGWDTMLPTSSCGTRMSTLAFGHTGFTGTSLWLDPATDAYVVLLTNRVCPSRMNNAILEVRRSFHDSVVQALCS